jgi:hypothetical protein
MKMRKFIKIFIILLLALTFGNLNQTKALAQAQILTKKVKISDIQDKTLKVVLTGSDFTDLALKTEVKNRWQLSPYEFCTYDEFEKFKTSEDYYFLLVVKGQFRKETEPGICFLTLVKGGPAASKGIDKMLDVVTMPYASASEPSGREIVFLPALLDVMQDFVRKALVSDMAGYAGLSNYSLNLVKSRTKRIYFSEGDLSAEMNKEEQQKYFDDDMIVADEDAADSIFTDKTYNTLVSYTVAPTNPVKGSYCYKMLFEAETHKLYYYRRHRIGGKLEPGFLIEDIDRIASVRK